ncbi:MAG: GNAT family N-acetyltransferase [Clostridiales bacterium]|nr:GNAT family N-acetyltransferase [Clostridiales bacterium]
MVDIDIREARKTDLKHLLLLYRQLHNNQMPIIDKNLEQLWNDILSDPNHHIIVGIVEEKIVSSCVIVIIKNLTHNQQPYALIENVITSEEFRGKGYATKILKYAKTIAESENCYKIMLMTGSKKESTLNFYKKAGYNDKDKIAFVQWIDKE